MRENLSTLMDKLSKGTNKTKKKTLFFRATQDMLDVLDYIATKYGDNMTRSEIVRIVLIHGLTDLMKNQD